MVLSTDYCASLIFDFTGLRVANWSPRLTSIPFFFEWLLKSQPIAAGQRYYFVPCYISFCLVGACALSVQHLITTFLISSFKAPAPFVLILKEICKRRRRYLCSENIYN